MSTAAHGGLAASQTAAIGVSSLELEEPGARSIQWHSWLQDYVSPARQQWGRQLRSGGDAAGSQRMYFEAIYKYLLFVKNWNR